MLNQAESRTDSAPKFEPATAGQLGRSVVVKGQLTGSEDLTVDGRVEGVIDLGEHALTIGPNATIEAEIRARTVTIFGSVHGNVTVLETLHLRHGASLEGAVVCGSIVIQDRAHFSGTVEMPDRRQAGTGGELPRSAVA
jgi:cytoskeletal protein CcmA (bactofilin family)